MKQEEEVNVGQQQGDSQLLSSEVEGTQAESRNLEKDRLEHDGEG